TITRNETERYKVTGVFADCPANSHLKFNLLLSYITFSDVYYEGQDTETAMSWDGFYSYLLLKPNTDWKALEVKIPDAVERAYDVQTRESIAFYLQPLRDIHLTSNYLIEAEANGNGRVVNFLFIIGISVLLIAWFNYINLSTANSELRAREVGVRKVLGGSPNKLIGQFLTEAALLNVFAILCSFILVRALQPFFESLIGEEIKQSLFSDGRLLLLTAFILLVGTLLSALYPSFFLSSFKPIKVLKPGFTGKRSGGSKWLGKGLVTIQFIASVALIVGTLIVYRQLHYLQDTKLGLNIDQTLILKGPTVIDSTLADKSELFKEKIENIANVKKLAGSTSIPGQSFGWTAGGVHRLGMAEEQSENFHVMAADIDYTQLYEMELAAGRHMSNVMGSDSRTACLLNETGSALLGFNSPEEAIGQSIEFWGEQFTIIGVLKDFYQESAKAAIEPLVLRSKPADRRPTYYSIKLTTHELSSSLAGIEQIWSNLFPGNTFEYFFLDDHFNQLYASEQRFSRVFTLFSGLAILVSCLGLFALVTFMTERKKKEIGVRRVLGASVSNIVGLLSKDFLKLIVLALLIATPLSWYAMQQWLESFANRITIPWWYFALAGVLAMGIAFATVSFQSIRAALADPVDTLRTE
ncbi:MAG: FtsX-like permease family protein, partial [Lewinella sp.]|nr:FtsX-like permease family protein [Lewinella sp.]